MKTPANTVYKFTWGLRICHGKLRHIYHERSAVEKKTDFQNTQTKKFLKQQSQCVLRNTKVYHIKHRQCACDWTWKTVVVSLSIGVVNFLHLDTSWQCSPLVMRAKAKCSSLVWLVQLYSHRRQCNSSGKTICPASKKAHIMKCKKKKNHKNPTSAASAQVLCTI